MRARNLAILWAFLLLAGGAPAAEYNPRMHKEEWRYVDAEDEARAAKLLKKLLLRYKGERGAEKLVRRLRKGRPYMSGLPRHRTEKWKCADGITREFTYYLPARYSPRKPTGVLVFLHGAVRQPPPGGGAHEARELGRAVDDLRLIKIGPSTFGGHEWGETAVRELVHHALEYVKQRFNVDENRVYLAGDSDGGRGTYALAETEATFYAAAVPVIGAPGGVTRFVNLRQIPWFAINGEKDSIFKLEHVRPLVEAMKGMEFDLAWKLVPGAPHDPFLFVKMKDEVCDFLRKHPRDPLPKAVDWQFDPAKKGYEAGYPANTFRWIRIDEAGETESKGGFDDFGGYVRRSLPRIRAAKGKGNRVEVDTWRVRRFTILVSDEMFDLDQEIEVLVNGKPAFKGRVASDTRVVLEEMRHTNDRRLVFNNRITLEVK